MMVIDLDYREAYKTKVIEDIATRFSITSTEAHSIYEILESEDFFRLIAPERTDIPAEVLILKSREQGGLAAHSYKPGNLIIKANMDWARVADVAISSVGTVVDAVQGNPVGAIVKILGALLSSSSLIKIQLDENKTAIIMALQGQSQYRRYIASTEQCLRDANQILSNCGYDGMSEMKFQREIECLLNYHCIERENGGLKLIERISVPY